MVAVKRYLAAKGWECGVCISLVEEFDHDHLGLAVVTFRTRLWIEHRRAHQAGPRRLLRGRRLVG